MGKGLGSVEKRQNSKKAWGVGGRQLQTLKAGAKEEAPENIHVLSKTLLTDSLFSVRLRVRHLRVDLNPSKKKFTRF